MTTVATVPQREVLPPISEREFMRQVVEVAALFGWTVYHPQLSKWSERGYPDLTLVRPPRIVFIECKTEKGKTTIHQDRWLRLLGDCPGVEVMLARPSDFERIAELLR